MDSEKKIMLSGIQPSGDLHLGIDVLQFGFQVIDVEPDRIRIGLLIIMPGVDPGDGEGTGRRLRGSGQGKAQHSLPHGARRAL